MNATKSNDRTSMLLKAIFVKTIKNHAPAKTWTFAITHGNVGVKKIPEVNG